MFTSDVGAVAQPSYSALPELPCPGSHPLPRDRGSGGRDFRGMLQLSQQQRRSDGQL